MKITRAFWVFAGYLLLVFAWSQPNARGARSALSAIPPNFKADEESITLSSISWTWGDVLGETAYEFHDEDDTLLAELPENTIEHTLSNLDENSQHNPHVHSRDFGELSGPSNNDAKFTLVRLRPFTLTVLSDSSIFVDTQRPPNPIAGDTGVRILRRKGDTGAFAEVRPFEAVYTFPDTGLEPGTRYCYKIQYRNGDRRETETTSDPICATTEEEEEECKTHLKIPAWITFLPEGHKGGDELLRGNKKTLLVKWTGEGDPKIITVTIKKGAFGWRKGQCLNKGKKEHPDYVFAQDNQVEKTFWDIADGVPEYGVGMDLTAESRKPVPADETHAIVITSYDWGGACTIEARADDCEPDEKELPRDRDTDKLPDRWEAATFFWNDAAQKIQSYNIGNPLTTGTGDLDGDTDLDVGFETRFRPRRRIRTAFPSKIHDEVGDGFSAFEEYRGLFVQGGHFRMDELANDGGPTSRGRRARGTLLKNLFIHDPDSLIRPNRFLILHGIAFHRIKNDEMSKDGDRAGVVNTNGENNQRAVWIKIDNTLPAGILANSQGNGVNAAPLPILINSDFIAIDALLQQSLDGRTIHTEDDLTDYNVAHELGHKFDLVPDHYFESYSAGLPQAAFGTAKYWLAPDANNIRFWTVQEKVRFTPTGRVGFEELLFPSIDRRDVIEETRAGAEIVHIINGVEHRVQVIQIKLRGAGLPDPFVFLIHKHDLMDWSHDHTSLPDTLDPEVRKMIRLKK